MKFVNNIFEEFAKAFVGQLRGNGEIAFPNELRRSALNYSAESLKVLDEYLEFLHKNRSLVVGPEAAITILRSGAYLGEVIRRGAKSHFNWVDYDEYIPSNPELREILGPRDVSTCAFICENSGNMYMPLNKVVRFIAEGIEHSTHYFASVALRDD